MINTGILKKCLDELSKESPRLDYVRGMLETLVDMQEGKYPLLQSGPDGKITVVPTSETVDTPLPPLPDLNQIKAIAQQSMND